MNLMMLIPALALLPLAANASTKHIECNQTTDDGVAQVIFAVIDDTSDKAEVQSFALSAACAKDKSCGTNIYNKDTLPSVIRLTNIIRPGGVTYTTTIDIDRTSLAVVTRTKLTTAVGTSDSIARGQCTVTVDDTKKVL